MSLSDEEILKAREKNYQLQAAKHEELIEELKEALSAIVDDFVTDITTRIVGPYIDARYKVKYEKRLSRIEKNQIYRVIRAYAKELVQMKFTSQEREIFEVSIDYFDDKELHARLEVVEKPSSCIIL